MYRVLLICMVSTALCGQLEEESDCSNLSPAVFSERLKALEEKCTATPENSFMYDIHDEQALRPIQNFMEKMGAHEYTQCLVDVAASSQLTADQKLNIDLINFPPFQELTQKTQQEKDTRLLSLLAITTCDENYAIRRLLYGLFAHIGADQNSTKACFTPLARAVSNYDSALIRCLVSCGAKELGKLPVRFPKKEQELLDQLRWEHDPAIKGAN